MSLQTTTTNPDTTLATPAPQATATAGSAPALASTASIPTAFSVGWLLAELAGEAGEAGEVGEVGADVADRLPDGAIRSVTLHGSAASLLAAVPAANVRVRQIQAKVSLLKADLDRAGVPEEASTALDGKLKTLASEFDGGSNGASPSVRVDVVTLVGEVTQDALANLTAASARLGRAFSLGYDLANTCAFPRGGNASDLARLFGTRVVDVQEALADLASSLPEHAGRSVALSLAQWQHWAVDPRLSKNPVLWPQEGVEEALARQGQVWRSVLSGEKLGKDMLAADDYFGAGRTLLTKFFRHPLVWLGLFVGILAIGAGLYLFVTQPKGLAKIGGAVLSALGAIGITTASLSRALSDVTKEIETEVWGAELDYAIADAVTVPPGDWRVTLKKIDVPPPRGLDPHVAAHARAVHRIARAAGSRRPKLVRRWRVQQYLHNAGTYETLAGVITSNGGRRIWQRRPDTWQRMVMAKKLMKREPLRHDPAKVAAGAPGRIVSLHRHPGKPTRSAFVWTFHHGRIHHVKEYEDYAAARADADQPGPSKEVSVVLPVDDGPPPPPIRHATDRQKLRQADAEVRKRLTPAHQRLADHLMPRADRLALRASRGKGSPDVFMPRDPYLSLVQNALERRLEFHQADHPPAGAGASGAQAADGTSVALGDQLFDRFGPDDFGWMTTLVEAGLTALDGDKHPFGTTPTERRLGERARLVLLADWGTGTPRAHEIAKLAQQRLEAANGVDRHLIHLGDVYYCGLPGEYRSRFLDCWPVSDQAGRENPVTSWNLNGNHDMYSGGHGYFDVIAHPPFAQQRGTSCFRLFNDHWQFIALDTAYADNDLHETQLPWLEQWVDAFGVAAGDGKPRRTVLLSHHQLGSALAQRSVGAGIRDKTAKVRGTGRIYAWFWGHEHRCFVYKPYMGVQCPVCLGNGGVPELLSHRLTLAGAFGTLTNLVSDLTGRSKSNVAAPKILYQPTKPDTDSDRLKWAKLGFVVVDLDGATGSAVYIDEDNREVAIEEFGSA